ncbi:hypothetical protein GJV85_08680 [Sulfurimonas aquatica]|uniref:RCK N-terminal domain-containing protein n=1 Tax=Sulfurimonas aquatica TaxID=2672570 RepID=A0A975B145_9BACT|nr:NAD-binding protein [Sulfurimonas aquatica]QSZ42183.1 hypothetical protein GJV85_08680 [Sulfurimonas aquatica]
MNKLKQIVNEYKASPSVVYFLLENKPIAIGIIALLAFTLRFFLSFQTKDLLDSLSSALEFASIISASFIAILIYFKDFINKQLITSISVTKHTVVFGLGEFSTALLENDMHSQENKYIIFEKNMQNEKIEHFRKSGMGVVEGDVFDEEQLSKLNFDTMDYAVIALGNDRLNVELATLIMDYYATKEIKSPIKLVVHIINQDLNAVFHQNIVATSNKESQIDIQTFSFYEAAADTFFSENYVDGQTNEIIESSEGYNIAIVGDGELALNMIYQIAKLAHLPNENKLTIHLVDKNADVFRKKVIKRYSGIEHVLALEVVAKSSETIEFYDNEDLWFTNNLTHAVVCYDDEEKNIQIAIDLFNKTYIADAHDMKTRVSFAIFNAYKMSNKINVNKEAFKQFFTFGNVKEICTRENLLDEKNDLLSKLVHNAYADNYKPMDIHDLNDIEVLKKIHDKWYDSSKLSDKLSSKAQSKHIPMKLKALGLQQVKSQKSQNELLMINRAILDATLKQDRNSLNLDNERLQNYSHQLPKLWGSEEDKNSIDIMYFPQEYKTMFEKLIRAEHNRWNAFHYLNGWKYKEVKSKPKKEHDCLLPLKEFKKKELQLTILYDMYAILYIPNYLANAGYEIVEGKY